MIERLKRPLIAVLRWSERYTKTDMVYLASGGFWFGLGQAVSSLSALALAVAFANLVPPETYGTYKYILSIAGMFAIFSLPGLSTAVTRAVAQGHEGVIRAATRSRVAHSFVGSVIALGGASYYFLNGNVELSLALLIIAATLPVFDTFTLHLAYFVGKRRFDIQNIYNSITHTFSTFILIIIIFLTDNLAAILLAYFIPFSSLRFYFYIRTLKKIIKNSNVEFEEESLRYGKNLTAIGILSVIASNIDKILLWKFLGPTQLAVYAFAVAIPEQIKGSFKSLGELAFPKFAKQTPEQIRKNLPLLYRKVSLYAFALFCISIAYILLAPFLFKLLFPQYMGSVVYSQIASLVFISMINSVLIKIFESQKKIGVQYILHSTQSVFLIVLFTVLIPTFGIIGAILATLINRLIHTILMFGAIFLTFRKKT